MWKPNSLIIMKLLVKVGERLLQVGLSLISSEAGELDGTGFTQRQTGKAA